MALSKNPKYDLRLKQSRIFKISIICTLSILIMAFKHFPDIEKNETLEGFPYIPLITHRDIPPTDQKPKLPPPPMPSMMVEAPSDVLEDIPIPNIELDPNEITDIKMFEEKPDQSEGETFEFRVVEEQPEIIGGMAAIQKHLHYPELAVRAGLQGTVIIKAFIDENGTVAKLEVVKGLRGGCDEAALNAVSRIKFKPGKQRGSPVKCIIHIPVKFKLK